MNGAVEKVLAESGLRLDEIDRFCCSFGPGSFTGIRVAANIAKTFSYIYKRPMFALTSLELVHRQNPTQRPQLVLLNAFKNMVYAALYQGPDCIDSPKAVRVLDLGSYLEDLKISGPIQVVGDALTLYQTQVQSHSQLIQAQEPLLHPRAETLAFAAYNPLTPTIDWKAYIPLYIRASEAEEKLRIQ